MISQEDYEAAQNIVWDYEDQLKKEKKCDHDFTPTKSWVHRCSICGEMHIEKCEISEYGLLKDTIKKYKDYVTLLREKKIKTRDPMEKFEYSTQTCEALEFIIELEGLSIKFIGGEL